MKNLLLLYILSFAMLFPCMAHASDFGYSILQPGESDLSLSQAQDIASQYFDQNNLIGYRLCLNKDRYSFVSHFVCMVYNDCATNAWIIAIIDTTAEAKPESCFLGLVVVDSPTGEVLYFTDRFYWHELETWVNCIPSDGCSYAEMRAHFDLFTLPEYVMDRACFPEKHYLSEQEAYQNAYEEVASITGREYPEIEAFCNKYSTAELVTFPQVTKHPVWIVRVKGHLLQDESQLAIYVVAISAIDGTMWFAYDSQNVTYSRIDDSLCFDGIDINGLPQLGSPFRWHTILPRLNVD